MKFKGFILSSLIFLLPFISLLKVELLIANDTTPKFASYHDYAALTNSLKVLHTKYSKITALQSIGKTGNDKDIWLFTIGLQPEATNPPKSAICIVGNLEGNNLAGTEQILYTASLIAENYGKVDSITQLVDKHSFYFIPAVNIDAAEYYFQKPLYETQTNFSSDDKDYDGLNDEDGPEDLNGDGFITMMRVLDPEGEWLPDSSDVRSLKKANPLSGQKGIFRVELEGIDTDGDGLLNEDPPGGILLNLNFPYRYPRYKAHAGSYPLSASETRALVDFFMNHREIALVHIFGMDDNLVNPPVRPGKPLVENKKEEATQRQERKLEDLAIHEQDLFFYQAISKTYKKITQIQNYPSVQSVPSGLGQWLYFQFGIPAFTSRVWWPPQANDLNNQINKGDSTQNDALQKAKDTKPIKISTSKSSNSEELLWLKWIDSNQHGQGFIPWQKFKHPTLGEVEIGGFQPFLRTNPPVDLLAGFAQRHAQFTLYLASLIPEIKLSALKCEKQSDSVYLLTARITKTGFLPAKTVFAQDKQLGKPIIVRLNLNSCQLLSGNKQTKLKNLLLNGSEEKLEWLVFGAHGSKINLEILSETAGQLKEEIILN